MSANKLSAIEAASDAIRKLWSAAAWFQTDEALARAAILAYLQALIDNEETLEEYKRKREGKNATVQMIPYQHYVDGSVGGIGGTYVSGSVGFGGGGSISNDIRQEFQAVISVLIQQIGEKL